MATPEHVSAAGAPAPGVRAQPDEGDQRAEPVVGPIATETGQVGPAVENGVELRSCKHLGEPLADLLWRLRHRVALFWVYVVQHERLARYQTDRGEPASGSASAPAGGLSTISAAR
jgi:hypothetical protein